MMAKPMKTLELHYPMVQFLLSTNVKGGSLFVCNRCNRPDKVALLKVHSECLLMKFEL